MHRHVDEELDRFEGCVSDVHFRTDTPTALIAYTCPFMCFWFVNANFQWAVSALVCGEPFWLLYLCLCCSDRSEPSVGSSKAVCNTSSFILIFHTCTTHLSSLSLSRALFLSCHVLCWDWQLHWNMCMEVCALAAALYYTLHTHWGILYSLMYCLITLIFIRSLKVCLLYFVQYVFLFYE